MLNSLFPPIQPYKTGRLKVSDVHELYYEEVGNPDGKPVVFLHGGPGGGIAPVYRQFFDPQVFRVILFDQRGAGQSTPHADLSDNTTWDLVEDIEKLREHVGVDRWLVFGGSWGSTLSLAYAETHPEQVKGLILRGIFLCRPKEIEWFYQRGADAIFPETWQEYLRPIPEGERGDLVKAYHQRLISDDKSIRLEAAKAWSVWEASASFLHQDPDLINTFGEDDFATAFARIECHYFTNNAFFKTDNWLIENVDKIRHIPCEIVHGRYDIVCPIISAYELNQAWPESKLHVIADAGHSALEVGITSKLIEILSRFREL
ncbi:MAG: prolyl aminopeptidase [Bdellovibrionaceae bacterium]|nr:prolyl aminopeptidase [Bdellovibrionales bacterium]MCB9084132.1 prolyl aminopeptidase [Pseudobdellovibrionaceae bacterium]